MRCSVDFLGIFECSVAFWGSIGDLQIFESFLSVPPFFVCSSSSCWGTLLQTNIALEKWWMTNYFPFLLSGTLLVWGRVDVPLYNNIQVIYILYQYDAFWRIFFKGWNHRLDFFGGRWSCSRGNKWNTWANELLVWETVLYVSYAARHHIITPRQRQRSKLPRAFEPFRPSPEMASNLRAFEIARAAMIFFL